MIDTNNDAAMRAEAERRTRLVQQGKRTFDEPTAVALPRLDERTMEKHIERLGDELMLALGFEVVRLSQARASKVTPGVPDRRYMRRPRPEECDIQPLGANVVWVEYKSPTGKQRPDQRAFQEMVEACGESYVLGGVDALVAWLESRGLGTVRDGAFEPREGG